MPDFIKMAFSPIHQEGLSFVTLFGVITLIAGLFWQPLWLVGLVLTLWCAYFFRDPKRFTPVEDGLIISPADGIVSQIRQASPPEELAIGNAQWTRIAIFMNVFNVHVNRTPTDGTITKLHYRPGKMLNASLDKASEENERQSFVVKTQSGIEIACVQIAGLIARRILCTLSLGDDVQAGQRFGLIRFGSRVDIYLPPEVTPKVAVGQTMVAGETVLATLKTADSQAVSPSAYKVEVR